MEFLFVSLMIASLFVGTDHCPQQSKTLGERLAGVRPTLKNLFRSMYAMKFLTGSNHASRVGTLDLDSEDDIRWDELIDARWNQCMGHKLQQRWIALKKVVHMPDGTHRGEYTT